LRLSGVRENRILKGTDRYGNRYYEFNDDDTIKRKIEFAEGNEKLEYESEFWHEWLKY
jgi:NADH:ubiquinone oxidoreductase subunit